MKTLYIILLITGVALFLSLASCGKEERPMPPMPSLPKDTVVQYARDISFDSLTAGQVRQFLQSQGKWKIEAQYISEVRDYFYYYPPDTGSYIEFTANDSLRFFTDSGIVTEKISSWYPTFVGGAHIAFDLLGISNYRLILKPKIDRPTRFYCIPEAINLKELPQPNLAQKESLLDLPVYQIMQLLSGTKWKIWKSTYWNPWSGPDEDDSSELIGTYSFEFIGTDTLYFVANSIGRYEKIERLYETEYPGSPVSKVFETSYDGSYYYYGADIYINELAAKKITLYFSFDWCSDCGSLTYYADLVE